METKNLPSTSAIVDKNQLNVNEPKQELLSLPGHCYQFSSSDIAKAEFQQYLNFSNDDVSDENEDNEEEIEKDENNWTHASTLCLQINKFIKIIFSPLS